MPELVVVRGVPGSGKTTWARAWVAEGQPGKRARVNRDDLRGELFGATGASYMAYFKMDSLWEHEKVVTEAEHGAARAMLEAGVSVVVDATNIRTRYVRAWAELAGDAGADFIIKDFTDVPLDVCIARDLEPTRFQQGKSVGEDVVRDMHEKMVNTLRQERSAGPGSEASGYRYTPDAMLPRAWIVDIDGTLALHNGRNPHDLTRVSEDKPNPAVVELVQHLAKERSIIVVSGREGTEQCRRDTVWWLDSCGVPFNELFMRPVGDRRPDELIKLEILRDKIAPAYQVLGVLDDRNRVVRMWRRVGLLCLQVAPGAF